MTSEQDATLQSEFNEELEYEMEAYDEDMGGLSLSEGMKGVEEEDGASQQEEEFSRLGESSDDAEQKRLYLDYLSLIKEIEFQNQIIADIKGQIMEMSAKACKTRCEMKEIKRLRNSMEQENLKLQCLIEKAMKLQNFGSRRRYQEIPLVTTIDEDNMSPYESNIPSTRMSIQPPCWKPSESSEADKVCSCGVAKDDKRLRCLCKAIGKLKVCCPEDKKLIKEIAATLLNCGNKKQQETPCHKKQRNTCSTPRKCIIIHTPDEPPCEDSLDKLKHKIMCMQNSVNVLRQEICKKEKEKKEKCKQQKPCNVCQEEPDHVEACLANRNTKAYEFEKLKENYMYLLTEFAKKDTQLKELEERLKGLCGDCDGNACKGQQQSNANESELQILRTRVYEMKEEQVEFQCIMKEQSIQLEDYRNKYLTAQQKVEELTVTVEKLKMDNKCIENQINTEIKEIRTKFQEKLNELLHFPKLLECEQLKLAACCKEKEELEKKLVLVCKELQSLKNQVESPKENTDCRSQLVKCQLQLEELKAKLVETEKQRDLFCEQLKIIQADLDTLRSESAKIIARTKERTELIRQQLQLQINCLEKELAQCRATACLSVSDREAVIKEMQGQLNTLSYSFDAAQKQIKTLRNHIAYVSNENCFPTIPTENCCTTTPTCPTTPKCSTIPKCSTTPKC